MPDPVTGCPSDYSDFFASYWPYVKQMVAKAGIASEDVEDVAMEVVAKFIEKDALSYFDPDYTVNIQGPMRTEGSRTRHPRFSSLLKRFCYLYSLTPRDKQEVRHRNVPLRLEGPHPDRSGDTLVDRLADESCASTEDDWCAAMDATDALTRARGDFDEATVILFDHCLAIASAQQNVNPRSLAKAAGIKQAEATVALTVIQETLAVRLDPYVEHGHSGVVSAEASGSDAC